MGDSEIAPRNLWHHFGPKQAEILWKKQLWKQFILSNFTDHKEKLWNYQNTQTIWYNLEHLELYIAPGCEWMVSCDVLATCAGCFPCLCLMSAGIDSNRPAQVHVMDGLFTIHYYDTHILVLTSASVDMFLRATHWFSRAGKSSGMCKKNGLECTYGYTVWDLALFFLSTKWRLYTMSVLRDQTLLLNCVASLLSDVNILTFLWILRLTLGRGNTVYLSVENELKMTSWRHDSMGQIMLNPMRRLWALDNQNHPLSSLDRVEGEDTPGTGLQSITGRHTHLSLSHSHLEAV